MVYTRALMLLFTVLPLYVPAQPPLFENKLSDTAINAIIEKHAAKFMSDSNHTGLSIGLVTRHATFTFHYGSIDKLQDLKPTDNTIYEIASLTKSFTGILLANAVLEKKLSLNDDIRKYLPGNYANLVYKGQPIRIIHLANHTAGLQKFLPVLDLKLPPSVLASNYKDYSKRDFLHDLKKIKLQRTPGERYQYSNVGTQLIGIILENIYHKSYSALLEKYITSPCRMKATKIQLSQEDTTHLSKAYNKDGQLMPELSFWRNVPAAGYLKSTTSDLLKYIQLNIDEAQPAIALSHKVTVKNTDEYNEDIGLCWFSKTLNNGVRKIDHAGGSFGFTSYCLIYPSLKIGVVCLTNDASPDTERQLRKLAEEILNSVAL